MDFMDPEVGLIDSIFNRESQYLNIYNSLGTYEKEVECEGTGKIIFLVKGFTLETESASALSNTRLRDSQQQFGRLHSCCSG